MDSKIYGKYIGQSMDFYSLWFPSQDAEEEGYAQEARPHLLLLTHRGHLHNIEEGRAASKSTVAHLDPVPTRTLFPTLWALLDKDLVRCLDPAAYWDPIPYLDLEPYLDSVPYLDPVP